MESVKSIEPYEADENFLMEVTRYYDGDNLIGTAMFNCGATKKVRISGAAEALAGETVNIVVEYLNWLDEACPEEDRVIFVRVGNNEIALNPVSGKAEFDFISNEPGKFVIIARGDFVCQEDQVTVRVQ